MSLVGEFPDRQYTYIFHSPGIEPWICGLLKNRTINKVLDLGCGIGLWGFLIKSYVSSNAKVFGVDISVEKLKKLRSFNIYDELILGDITTLMFNDYFDVILVIEVFHKLHSMERFLADIEARFAKETLIVISGPSNSNVLRILQKRNYIVYFCFLRGLILVNAETGKTKVMWESEGIRILGSLFRFGTKILSMRNSRYIIAFKQVN